MARKNITLSFLGASNWGLLTHPFRFSGVKELVKIAEAPMKLQEFSKKLEELQSFSFYSTKAIKELRRKFARNFIARFDEKVREGRSYEKTYTYISHRAESQEKEPFEVESVSFELLKTDSSDVNLGAFNITFSVEEDKFESTQEILKEKFKARSLWVEKDSSQDAKYNIGIRTDLDSTIVPIIDLLMNDAREKRSGPPKLKIYKDLKAALQDKDKDNIIMGLKQAYSNFGNSDENDPVEILLNTIVFSLRASGDLTKKDVENIWSLSRNRKKIEKRLKFHKMVLKKKAKGIIKEPQDEYLQNRTKKQG